MLQWFCFYNRITILSLFPHIVQSYTYEQLSLLFRGRNASLHLFALLSSTEQHYVSTEHEPWSWGSVLRCVPAERKTFHSISLQVQVCIEVIQPPAPLSQFLPTLEIKISRVHVILILSQVRQKQEWKTTTEGESFMGSVLCPVYPHCFHIPNHFIGLKSFNRWYGNKIKC